MVTLPPGGVVGDGITVPGGEVPGLNTRGNSRAIMITATTAQITAPMINQLYPAVGDQLRNELLHVLSKYFLGSQHSTIYCTRWSAC